MPGDLYITKRLVVPETELSERFSRSSGPGGQGVNTTDSRVELSFDVARSMSVPEDLRPQILQRLRHRLVDGIITLSASQSRSQLANRQDARDRLKLLLAEATAPPPPRRRPTKPTKASRQRRLADKKRRAVVKKHRGRGIRGEE